MTGDPEREADPAEAIVDRMLMTASVVTRDTKNITTTSIRSFFAELMQARRVFTVGTGRSGLVASAFAMRLMHLGYRTYVIGETIVPDLTEERGEGDLLVVVSGSGITAVAVRCAEEAKERGGRVCLVTYTARSPLERIADCVVLLPCDRTGADPYFAPLGTAFETTALIFTDAAVSELMKVRMIPMAEMSERHANLPGLDLLPGRSQ